MVWLAYCTVLPGGTTSPCRLTNHELSSVMSPAATRGAGFACRSEKVLKLLEDHIYTITSRINTLTGVAYKDDPTIMGYNLFNEPRWVRV